MACRVELASDHIARIDKEESGRSALSASEAVQFVAKALDVVERIQDDKSGFGESPFCRSFKRRPSFLFCLGSAVAFVSSHVK